MNEMHRIRQMILDLTACRSRVKVERRLWDIAFPQSMVERDPCSLATAIVTLALARSGNRPESTRHELEERFCVAHGLSFWKDQIRGDVWVEATASRRRINGLPTIKPSGRQAMRC